MTIKDLEQLSQEFRDLARQLREAGEQFPSNRASAVLFSANVAAGYAELAANYVDGRIETEIISAIAMEERQHVQRIS